ncbi:MAG TPA: hypothetical protein VKS79_07835 [Gemmataceae bacterium]|nr:hypothetical protein [Gemmataceae bacterium]
MPSRSGILRCLAISATCLLAPWCFAEEAQIQEPWAPNCVLQVSERMGQVLGEKDIDRTAPIRDTILKTEIFGLGHTTGKINIDFVPCEQAAIIDLVMNAETISQTIGYRRLVQAHTIGHTTIYGRKRIYIDASGIRFDPAWSWNWPVPLNQYLTTQLRSPCLDQVVRNIAERGSKRKEEKFRAILRSHIEERTDRNFNEDSDPGLMEANRSFQSTLRRLAGGRELMPDRLLLKTSDTEIFLLARMSDDPAAPKQEAPPLTGQPGIALRLHESWLEAAANRMFAGKTETAETMRQEIINQLGPVKRPQPKETEDDRQSLAITFANSRPVEFHFADNTAAMVIHANEFRLQSRTLEGMDITASYKLEKTETGLRFTRLGDLKIVPRDYTPGKRLSASQMTIRALLQRVLGDVFQEVMELDEIPVPSMFPRVGKLLPTQVQTANGWLVLSVSREKPKAEKP